MKVSGITVGNETPRDKRTIEQIVESEWAETLSVKLLVALAAETAWSGEYDVYAHLSGDKPYLIIQHASFLPGHSLVVHPGPGIETVRDVEDAVRAHLKQSEDSLKPVLSLLQSKQSNLYQTQEAIAVGKAKAAIVAVFPEAVDAYHNSVLGTGHLLAFVLNGDGDRHEQVFVAREMDGEFVRGIARINTTAASWYAEKNNTDFKKHCRFWKALATAFAKEGLHFPEEFLERGEVDAEEKEHLWPRPVGYDPYIVREVRFRPRFTDEVVIVTFGANNLPVDAALTKAEVEA